MNKDVKISKFLSFVLRHQPQAIGINLDENGWVDVVELIEKTNRSNNDIRLTEAVLEEVVRTNSKKRFAFSDDGTQIRASQGHSVKIDLDLKPVEPPEKLFHGTATRFVDSILKDGLIPKQRHHVHLSKDLATASQVGKRHGKLAILEVDTKKMYESGYKFYVSDNGVWLTDSVPVEFIKISML